jgi:hypothetical protein
MCCSIVRQVVPDHTHNKVSHPTGTIPSLHCYKNLKTHHNNIIQITLAVSFNTIQAIMLHGTPATAVWYILVIHWQSPTIFQTDQRMF